MTGRGGRRCNKLQDELKGNKRMLGTNEGTLDGTPRRICFERGYGPIVRQTTEKMNKYQLVK